MAFVGQRTSVEPSCCAPNASHVDNPHRIAVSFCFFEFFFAESSQLLESCFAETHVLAKFVMNEKEDTFEQNAVWDKIKGKLVEDEGLLRKVFKVIQSKMRTIGYHKHNREIIFEILEAIFSRFYKRGYILHISDYVLQNIDIFLLIAANEQQHSADSKLWHVIGILGMLKFVSAKKTICDLCFFHN